MNIVSKTNLMQYVKEALQKIDGLYIPVKASFFDQMFIKKLNPSKLYPNPRDEFCSDEIGPNYEIVEKYVKQITKNKENEVPLFDEPLIIEKMKPDGFMLLNGHHRWAAALILKEKSIPVKIINLTHASDIIDTLEKSKRDKRASINLDDVVISGPASENFEKPLNFPYNRIFRERIHRGIPALFYALHEEGYDVWIYTSGFASTDYITQLFRHYHIEVDGIINGTTRLKADDNNKMKQAKSMLQKKYPVTLHIDTDSILRTQSGSKEFEQYEIESKDEKWANNVITIVRSLK